MNTTKEVKSVASPLLVELRLQVLKLLKDDLVFLRQIVESDAERSWFLSKEVRIVLDSLNESLPRQEPLG